MELNSNNSNNNIYGRIRVRRKTVKKKKKKERRDVSCKKSEAHRDVRGMDKDKLTTTEERVTTKNELSGHYSLLYCAKNI
jgi:hypothetical protein